MPANKKKPAKKKFTKLTKKAKSTLDHKYEKYKLAIKESGGFISQIAKSLGITHQAVSLYIKAHPELQELLQEFDDFYLDLSENVVLGKIKKGDLDAAKYYLTHKGKNRGYYTKSQVDLTPGDPVKALFQSVEKQVESNPELKKKLDKELDDN